MVFFQDEAIFGRINSVVSCWAPAPIRPQVPHQLIRQFVYVFSALCPATGDNFTLILPHANTAAMQIFLTSLSKNYADCKLILVADQASWHTAKNLVMPDNVRILYLPPRSPELNPVEHLWKYVRENYFHNREYSSLDALENALVATFENLDKTTLASFAGFHWIVDKLLI